MAKVLHLRDLVPSCRAVIEGKDVADVLKKRAEHAKTAHGMATIPPSLKDLPPKPPHRLPRSFGSTIRFSSDDR